MVECSVFHNKTSVNCDINFTDYHTPGCGPFCWKGMWIGCSVITCLVGLFMVFVPVASRHIQQLRPASNTSIVCSLMFKPYFWYLNIIVLLVVVYDAAVQYQNDVSGSEQVEIGVIVSKLLTVILIFQLNFTYPPRTADGFSRIFLVLYYMTLSIFFLDNLCKFVELTVRISYRLNIINSNMPNRQLQVVGLLSEIVDAALYHSFANFFWNKIFRGRSDVLMTYSPDLAMSLRDATGRYNREGPDS